MNPNAQPPVYRSEDPPDYSQFTRRDESSGIAPTRTLRNLSGSEDGQPEHSTSNDTGIISSLKSVYSRLTGHVLLTSAEVHSGFPNAIIHKDIGIASNIKKQWLMLHYTKGLARMEVIPEMYRFDMVLPQSLWGKPDMVNIPGTMYMLLCLRVIHTPLGENQVSRRKLGSYEDQMSVTRGTKLTMTASVRQTGDPGRRNISILATLPSCSSPTPKQSEGEPQAPQEGTSTWRSLGNHLGKNKAGKGKGKGRENEERTGNDASEGLQLTEVNNDDPFKPKFTHTLGFQSCSDPKPMDGGQSIQGADLKIAVLFRLDVDDLPIVDVSVSSELYSAPYGDDLSKSFELTVKEVQRKLRIDQRTGEDEYNDRQECVLGCVGRSWNTTDVYNDNIEDEFHLDEWEENLVPI